jgi:hypothetical protein
LGMDYVRLGLAIDNTGKVNYMNGTVNYWDMAYKSKWYGEKSISYVPVLALGQLAWKI